MSPDNGTSSSDFAFFHLINWLTNLKGLLEESSIIYEVFKTYPTASSSVIMVFLASATEFLKGT